MSASIGHASLDLQPEHPGAAFDLRVELRAALGYLLNAKIDLETGAPKRTALMTLDGGIKRVRAALAEV